MISNEKIKEVMSSVLGVESSLINDQFSSDVYEQWDSLKHLNLILALEEEFDMEIPDEEAANLTSFALIKIVLNEVSKG